MEKFEIINGKWIKGKGTVTEAIKIGAINKIYGKEIFADHDERTYFIYLCVTGHLNQFFSYSNSEKDQYKRDLVLLEKLLFIQ